MIKNKQIDKVRLAILNLKRAIKDLKREKASDADLQPYRENLARYEAKLANLKKKGTK